MLRPLCHLKHLFIFLIGRMNIHTHTHACMYVNMYTNPALIQGPAQILRHFKLVLTPQPEPKATEQTMMEDGECFFTGHTIDTNLVVDSPCSFLELTDKTKKKRIN